MAASTAVQLTKQFYAWEQRGRGWYKAEFACDLEPPFAPFFGHSLPESPIIDDGKRPSFFHSLFGTTIISEEDNSPQEEEIKAYPYNDETPADHFLRHDSKEKHCYYRAHGATVSHAALPQQPNEL